MSLNESRGVNVSDLIPVMGSQSQYTKIVIFEHIQNRDSGNYNCTVNIVGYFGTSIVEVINGKCNSIPCVVANVYI